jgi:hypothetical protein
LNASPCFSVAAVSEPKFTCSWFTVCCIEMICALAPSTPAAKAEALAVRLTDMSLAIGASRNRSEWL